LTVGQGGDSLWTSPTYIQISDSIPPAAAIMLEAVCDSNGFVKITWKHHGEQDLHAFKLYRANYQNEEFSRVAAIERVDTIYYDTVALGTLTEQMYYKILAYDDSYNPSPFSNVIKAKRYDIIPPTSPVFSILRSDSTGIHLTWGNSSSEDVIKTVLYRKLRDESTWHEYKVFAKDTAKYTSFTDDKLYKGQWYEYTLQAFDDDKLMSGYTPSVQLKAFDNGIRPEIIKVSNKLDKRKKINKIKWVYPHQGVELYQIYRATNDGKLIILKSVQATQLEFYDTQLTAGRLYRYRIKAVYKDGGESPFSTELKVQF
jgi:fibronectin type 3 domain-containing protein